MYSGTRSTGLRRALIASSVEAELPRYLVPQADEPVKTGGPPDVNTDGVWDAGGKSGLAPDRLILAPVATGGPGVNFVAQVTGWWRVGDDAPSARVWWPMPLAQFACVTGDIPGVANAAFGYAAAAPNAASTRVVPDTEYACEAIVLLGGGLGRGRSAGAVYAVGGGWAAFATLDLCGCQKFQIDFACGYPADYGVAANALWGFC